MQKMLTGVATTHWLMPLQDHTVHGNHIPQHPTPSSQIIHVLFL